MVMEMNASDENMTVCVSVCVFACVYIKRCLMNTAIQVSHFVTWQTSLCVQKIGLEQVCLSFACTVDDAVFKRKVRGAVGFPLQPGHLAQPIGLQIARPCGDSMTDCDLTPLSFPVIQNRYHTQQIVGGERKKKKSPGATL